METLEIILSELQQFGAVLLHGNDAETATVEQYGVLPPNFYSTTNLPTQVRLNGQWVHVENIEMDVAVVLDKANHRAYSKPMHEVQIGEEVVIGHDGIRVQPGMMVFAFSRLNVPEIANRSHLCKALSPQRRSKYSQFMRLHAR